jgi:non-canonical purine NTP pyrophosphatase (RdgB/HAM1 family)
MITLVTSNPNKKIEIEEILVGADITTASPEIPEIQSVDLKEIVAAKAKAAYAAIGSPVLVEDVAFELDCLNGFPGPFVKWWHKVAGYDLAVEIAGLQNKYGAIARCGAAYCNGDEVCYVEGVVKGRLTSKKGESGFGFDPYFIPEGHEKTFAQMSPEAKNGLSHRARAFKELRNELKARGVL